jgi:hypothetical protein
MELQSQRDLLANILICIKKNSSLSTKETADIFHFQHVVETDQKHQNGSKTSQPQFLGEQKVKKTF